MTSRAQPTEEVADHTDIIASFDELKEQLCENIENLRYLWDENKDVLFSLNQVRQ